MSNIYQLPIAIPATQGTKPNFKFMVVGDDLPAITGANYLNQYNLEGFILAPTDIVRMLYNYNQQSNVGVLAEFTVSITGGIITLVPSSSVGYMILGVSAKTASTTHTQAGATVINTQITNVTVSNASDAISLPPAIPGLFLICINNGSTAGTVYGHGTDTINGTAGNIGSVTFSASKTTNFYCVAAGTWLTGNVA